MDVTVTSEVRFSRLPDDTVWADASSYQFWSRYLDEFDRVTIVGREVRATAPGPGMSRVDGPNVQLRGVPHYLGPREFLMRCRSVRRTAMPIVYERGALILRLGSLLGLVLQNSLLKSRRPYGVEVVGDPWDTFAPGVVDVPMRSAVRHVLTRSQRTLCSAATAAAYVTERTLQSRYPCRGNHWAVSDVWLDDHDVFTTHYSSVDLCASDFARSPHTLDTTRALRIIAVGSLSQAYKGIDVLVRAVHKLGLEGLDCELTVVGEGRYRAQLEQLARSLDVSVRFTSQIVRSELMAELDRADLFVMPSRTEGLPRALIEAMARGLPCIASRVGGIPELLDDSVLCDVGSVESLSNRIAALRSGRLDAAKLASGNLARAQDFREEVLRARRRQFYALIRAVTGEWNAARVAA